MLFSSGLIKQANDLLGLCRARQWTVSAAESCTGGLVMGLLTEVAGSSDVVDRGFVTYSNAAKQAMLGVSSQTLTQYGAVSEACARAMAEGALAASGSSMAVAITGIAGPGGGSSDKPVGLVHLACATATATHHRECRFGDRGRDAVRLAAVAEAIDLMASMAKGR